MARTMTGEEEAGANRIRKRAVFYFSSPGNLASPASAVMKLGSRALKEKRLVPEGAIIPTKRIERIQAALPRDGKGG